MTYEKTFQIVWLIPVTKNKNMWQLSKPIVGYYEDKQKCKEE